MRGLRSRLFAAAALLLCASALHADGIVNGGSSVTAGQLPGTATNDNASVGNVGQLVSSNIVIGSAVTLTTATPLDITTISLTAGDWDVQGACTSSPAGSTTTSVFICSVGTTLNTVNTTPSDSSGFGLNNSSQPAGGAQTIVTDTARFSLSATTTIHLVAQANFAVSTMGAYGKIRARRVR